MILLQLVIPFIKIVTVPEFAYVNNRINFIEVLFKGNVLLVTVLLLRESKEEGFLINS